MSVITLSIDETDSCCRALLQKAVDAFNARDVELALTCMDADIDWPNGIDGGYIYGHKAVHDYWIRQWNMVDPQMEALRYSKDEEGNIVVDIRLVVKDIEGNVIVDEVVCHAYLIMQGVIKRMEIRKIKTPLEPSAIEEEMIAAEKEMVPPQQQVA